MSSGLNMEDPGFLQTFLVQNARQLGMAGRILFPIPDRGLAGRIYRVTAKTVLVWGDSDRLIPPVYAQAWKRSLPNAELVSLPEAGHMITIEKPADVAAAIARLG
jgi:pimeloyl-ACP methyl ester carboxylesterase